jgi:pyridoxine 5'-phosphate synthase PdxJ
MQISLRSYLTAGVSLTAASAIALTPLAIPANQHAVTVPNVTISDIQLTVTPAEIQAFFAELQTQLEEFNQDVADAIALPGATLAGGLEIAIELNTDFYDSLKDLTSNATLTALLNALETSSNNGLGSLLTAVESGTEIVAITTGQLADLLASTITGSLSNVLSSFVNVLNNPLDTAAYAGLLSLGLVDTIEDAALNAGTAVGVAVNAGFDFAYTGLNLLQSQINNAIQTVSSLMTVAADATGSALVEGVNEAIQAITLFPALAVSNALFGLKTVALGGVQEGFNDILTGAGALIAITGGSLQLAINTIGANPLNPQNYLEATGVLIGGGFGAFNSTVNTIGSVAEIPFNRGITIATGVGATIAGINANFAAAFAGVLEALGLPEDIVALPGLIAGQINQVIAAGTEIVVEGLAFGEEIVAGTTATIINVSNEIEQAIFGVVPPVGAGATTLAVETEAPALRAASEPAGDPAGDVVPVSNESDDAEAPAEEAPAEEAPAEEAPAEEVPAEDTTDEEAPADDEAAGDDAADEDAADDDSAADDDAADDDAAADDSAAGDDSDADSGSDSDSGSGSDSDSGSSDSGSDSGSDTK